MPATAGLDRARQCVAAAVLWVAAHAACAQPFTYTLDPDRTWVHLEVLHFGISTIPIRIGPVGGEVVLDRSARRGEVRLTIPTAALSTGWSVFDARMAEPDLMASRSHPEAWFVATDFRFDGTQLNELRGEFTLRGISQPLALRALRFTCRSSAAAGAEAGVELCGGDFEAEVRRSDFGISFGLPFVGDRVRLKVSVLGRRSAR